MKSQKKQVSSQMHTILLGDTQEVTYELVRSERRTLSVSIEKDGMVKVRAPRRMPIVTIETFLREKQNWVIEHREKQQERASERPPISLRTGEKIPYLDRELTLQVGTTPGAATQVGTTPGAATQGVTTPRAVVQGPAIQDAGSERSEETQQRQQNQPTQQAAGISHYTRTTSRKSKRIQLCGDVLLVPETAQKADLEKWLRQQAKDYLAKRVAFLADRMCIPYQSLRISSARTNWGSCSGDNRINLSWYLILTPPEMIDYVIVHELCHTLHHDHSPAFWNCVAHFMPDYAKRRKWLKENSSVMELF